MRKIWLCGSLLVCLSIIKNAESSGTLSVLKKQKQNETTTTRSATARSHYGIALIISTIIMKWPYVKIARKINFRKSP